MVDRRRCGKNPVGRNEGNRRLQEQATGIRKQRKSDLLHVKRNDGGKLQSALQALREKKYDNSMHEASLVLSELISSDDPRIDLQTLESTVPVLCQFVAPKEAACIESDTVHGEIVSHALNNLAKLSWCKVPFDKRREILYRLVPPSCLEKFLKKECATLIAPALRILSHFSASADPSFTDVIICDTGVLVTCSELLSHPSDEVKIQCCHLLSNIAAGNASQIDRLKETHGLLMKVASFALDGPMKVKTEARWVIGNLFSEASHEQVHFFADGPYEMMEIIFKTLEENYEDIKLTSQMLDAVAKILKVASLFRSTRAKAMFINLIEQQNGDEIIVNIYQEHLSKSISDKAKDIITQHLDKYEVVEDDENWERNTSNYEQPMKESQTIARDLFSSFNTDIESSFGRNLDCNAENF